MKRRAFRDLGTIVGVVLILTGVVGVNIYMRLSGLKEKFDAMRRQYEQAAVQEGHHLLDWELLRTTKGSIRSGVKFQPELDSMDKQEVNLMGFMTPIDQFRNATHFMLLPLPIQCYFCQAPPLRDVMLVRLTDGETADMVEEPVLITGTLTLNRDGESQFFYTLENATRTTRGKTTVKNYSQQHRTEGYTMGKDLLLSPDHPGAQPAMPQEEMLPPSAPPTASGEASPPPAP